jgi:hypothetical protein
MHVVDISLPGIEPEMMWVHASWVVARMAGVEVFWPHFPRAERESQLVSGAEFSLVVKLPIASRKAAVPGPAFFRRSDVN